MRLSLDHLTVVDSQPAELAQIAASVGCSGMCAFLQNMEVLPLMPAFDLVADEAERKRTRAVCRDLGISVDLVYPFTLTARSVARDFSATLEAAADLGAECVNVLLYDRDPQRRLDVFADFCTLAARFGLKVAVEFFPPSQIPTLAAAVALVEATGPAEKIGLTLDLLHLMRAGEGVSAVALAPSQRLFVAQLCDGPSNVSPEQVFVEAAHERALPGEGAFELNAFVAALPAQTRISVEIPRDNDLQRGLARLDRAKRAVSLARQSLGAMGSFRGP